LAQILLLNQFCKILPFDNHLLQVSCELMINDSDYTDLEDTIQYILAKQSEADLFITNDKGFVAKEITKMSSEAFLQHIGI
jgi:predicted nucleic acid-binding protein